MLDAQALAAALARPIVFVDLETTGADAQRDRITEIGVVEVGPDGIQEWDTLVDPLTSIPPYRADRHHRRMVRGQPTFALIAEAWPRSCKAACSSPTMRASTMGFRRTSSAALA
jgi:DNA polymerase-3 subunit epsilon